MKTALLGLLLLFSCTQGEGEASAPQEPEMEEKVLATEVPQPISSQTSIDTTHLASYNYPWSQAPIYWRQTLFARTPAPAGYQRVPLAVGSFGDWLRHLPLAPISTPVKYHDGSLKSQQELHQAVISIDIGKRDLQQCADAVMRLRAEYLYSIRNYDAIKFNFTNGEPAPFSKWKSGKKIAIQNNRIKWLPYEKNNHQYPSFRRYMNQIFTYAGTASLSKELKQVASLRDMEVGDVLIKGGFPGHAVVVLDIVVHEETKEKLFMVAQSYMPAQSIHVLKNLQNPALGAWYSVEECIRQGAIHTPQWTFELNQLKRFDTIQPRLDD